MDMGWMLILIIWLVYPIAGTIAIVVLGIMNNNYKKKIKELLEEKQIWEASSRKWTRAFASEKEVETAVADETEEEIPKQAVVEAVPAGAKTETAAIPAYEFMDRKPIPKDKPVPVQKKIQVHPGMAALIIGVIFVVIAGLIFATTNWHIMPDMYKVIMVFGLAVLFFFSSRVAENRLKIERTGRAFYILGSIFLFLTVLAVGYFRLLGPGFVLDGAGRWWVLWVGSVVTEAAFLLGFSKYKERAFTWVYLGGLTVSVTFLMAALRSYGIGFANGMVCYAFVLLLIGWGNGRYEDKAGNGFLPENASVAWSRFSAVNFALSAGLMLPNVLRGFMAVYYGSLLHGYRITPWNSICVGLMAAGMAILAAGRKERRGYKILYRVMLAVFLQYAAMGIPVAMEYRYLLAAALHGGWFALARRSRICLWTETGDVICTGAAAGNTAILMIYAIRWTTMLSTQVTASAAVLILAGMMVLWSRKYPAMRRVVLYLLGLLTITGYGTCVYAGRLEVRYNYILFAWLVVAAVWDIVKKDCFWADILLIGAIPQVIALILPIKPAPFFLFLSVYLFIKTRGQERKQERLLFKASCICSLAGTYMELYWRLPNRVLSMFAVAALFIAEYLISARDDRFREEGGFWNVTGSLVFVALMAEYYQSGGLDIGYLAVCLCLFFLIYGKLYRDNCAFAHLPMAVAMLPLPWYIALAYDVTDGQILGGTAVVVLVSGILFRLHGPVHVADGDGENTQRVDWYHILVGPVLVILAGAGGRGWESVYTLLLILYVLQFATVTSLRKAAVTLAMALGAWLWWRQPFITIPEFIWLEVSLLPIAAAAAVLTKIWGDKPEVRGLRTGIQSLCLMLLTAAAIITGDVRDALILEVICLITFLAANKADSRFWKNTSGSILVLVALYMTKSFWLSLSWWVYLLAAGIGLIAFAAWNEMNKK